MDFKALANSARGPKWTMPSGGNPENLWRSLGFTEIRRKESVYGTGTFLTF